MFELDLRSRKPIYEQLVEKLKELIINEILKADEQLPSVRTLAGELTINPNTIQKAYRELENQGYIYSVKGRGSFVNPAAHTQNSEKMKNVISELEKLIAEGMYLGISSAEIIELIKKIEQKVGGGDSYDSTS
ncbi:GntR family transcriptional regulator [Bacillus sp. SG-1]|uniref:GntR family transcriptional regulator n=1 Tax=Bacillus sp. SG-1 TaxID=161544 RepID=UPI00015437C6|nr:GntR family transcriptional regulator [Bacillus sp. SG-1]EDL65851.1 transcriptional regulator (GntR family) protein [Bacillus sp. SG-1]